MCKLLCLSVSLWVLNLPVFGIPCRKPPTPRVSAHARICVTQGAAWARRIERERESERERLCGNRAEYPTFCGCRIKPCALTTRQTGRAGKIKASFCLSCFKLSLWQFNECSERLIEFFIYLFISFLLSFNLIFLHFSIVLQNYRHCLCLKSNSLNTLCSFSVTVKRLSY